MNKYMLSTVALAAMLVFSFAGDDKSKNKAAKGPMPGDAAPAFSLQDQNGQTHSLDQYKG